MRIEAVESDTRHAVMLKLLHHGPENTDHLVRITGWKKDEVQEVLLQLIAANQVRCMGYRSRKLYLLRS